MGSILATITFITFCLLIFLYIIMELFNGGGGGGYVYG